MLSKWWSSMLKPHLPGGSKRNLLPLSVSLESLDSIKCREKITLKTVRPVPLLSSKQCHFSNYLHNIGIVLCIINNQEMIYRLQGDMCRLYANSIHCIKETQEIWGSPGTHRLWILSDTNSFFTDLLALSHVIGDSFHHLQLLWCLEMQIFPRVAFDITQYTNGGDRVCKGYEFG